MPNVYHVAKNGCDENPGSRELPFLSINRAASAAKAGDIVQVHEGTYREWVDPQYSGLSEARRIIYEAAEGEKVCIKGSEVAKNWELAEGTVWKTRIDNSLFGSFNPFKEELRGDWLYYFRNQRSHRGDVYLNGMSLYEAEDLEEVMHPEEIREMLDHWTMKTVPVKAVQRTLYRWFAEVEESCTWIWANFQGADPNCECVEISVRPACFYPRMTGIDFITLRGFEIAQAATPWTPPTADQPGMVGAHWSKGWVIENNCIHDAKCAAVSLGKEERSGRNYRIDRKDKPGYNYQLEAVFTAKRMGWSKETIGSHLVRNNTIYNCEQCGIVGHMGAAFSKIQNNHIYNIGLKREFYGYEVGGIKLHAALDAELSGNRIHDCSLGTWMDWQTQGVRISRNIYYNNCRDLFVEVSHGPYTVDHNIFASPQVLEDQAQGGAFINNLFAGYILHEKVLDRATPYHLPHSTDIKGCAVVYGGDHRFIQNLFIADPASKEPAGTCLYDGYTTSLQEYIDKVQANWPGDLAIFLPVEQPVYIHDNTYLNGARAFRGEKAAKENKSFDPCFRLLEEGEALYLEICLPEDFGSEDNRIIRGCDLERVRIADADFENPDGSMLSCHTDLLGKVYERGIRGPLTSLKAGKNRIRIA